jgi:hypothetical protein
MSKISHQTADILWSDYESNVDMAYKCRKVGNHECADYFGIRATEAMQRIAELENEIKEVWNETPRR